MTTVSVVVPCYNHAQYLPYAIESVVEQTYSDWEAIVVDDGSTDNTREVAAQFTDPRIRYIHQSNQGLSAARNTGIRAARGEYLAFLDADDEWESAFLERCLGILRTQDPTIAGVYTRNSFISPQGEILPRMGGETVPPPHFPVRLRDGGFFPVHSALVRSDRVEEVGDFDEALTSLEDWDLWLRITGRGYTFQAIPEPLARYRVYPGSMSTDATRMHTNRIAVLTKHLGPPEGDPTRWMEEKRRAYGFAYRAAAYAYLQQHQSSEAVSFLEQAVLMWPPLLKRLDTFYELACGDQPRGQRGEAQLIDIKHNGAKLLQWLDTIFVTSSASLQALRGIAYGNAYLALAMLSDQAGQWKQARRYLLHALHANPAMVYQRGVMRRLLKLFVDKRIVNGLRKVQACPAVHSAVESEA